MSSLLPFQTQLLDDSHSIPCSGCRVYQAAVGLKDFAYPLTLCRVCLPRLRTTLKAAEKALPPLPKKVRPDDAMVG